MSNKKIKSVVLLVLIGLVMLVFSCQIYTPTGNLDYLYTGAKYVPSNTTGYTAGEITRHVAFRSDHIAVLLDYTSAIPGLTDDEGYVAATGNTVFVALFAAGTDEHKDLLRWNQMAGKTFEMGVIGYYAGQKCFGVKFSRTSISDLQASGAFLYPPSGQQCEFKFLLKKDDWHPQVPGIMPYAVDDGYGSLNIAFMVDATNDAAGIPTSPVSVY